MTNPIEAVQAKIDSAKRAATEAEGVAHRAALAESTAIADHAAHEDVVRRAKERLAELEAMETPTAKSLVDEEAQRRALAKLTARHTTLTEALNAAHEATTSARTAVEAALLAVARGELEAEALAIETEAVAFDARFRARLAAHRARAAELGVHGDRVANTHPDGADVIGRTVSRVKAFALAESRELKPSARPTETNISAN